MSSLAQLLLDAADWGSLRICLGTAAHVPEAVRELAATLAAHDSDPCFVRFANDLVNEIRQAV